MTFILLSSSTWTRFNFIYKQLCLLLVEIKSKSTRLLVEIKEYSTLLPVEIKQSVNITFNSTKALALVLLYPISSSKVKLQSYKNYNSSSKTSSSSPKISKEISNSSTQLLFDKKNILNFKSKEEKSKKSKNKFLSSIRF